MLFNRRGTAGINPFAEVVDEPADVDLTSQAKNGNRDALEQLILRLNVD